MMNKKYVDVVIVGGGQSGVSLSYYLQQRQVPHLILERDRAFSSWRNRWDGFRTNTPNWMNTLPVIDASCVPSNDPSTFATREEMVDYFDKCLKSVDAPIKTNTTVCRIVQLERGGWEAHTEDTIYEARNVAICIGAMSTPKLPRAAVEIPRSVPQVHSSAYRTPDQITTKSVLLVGSGSSGAQICRLLVEDGRFEQIHLAVSNVMILPCHIFGIQTHRLLHFFGLFDVKRNYPLGKLMHFGLEKRGRSDHASRSSRFCEAARRSPLWQIYRSRGISASFWGWSGTGIRRHHDHLVYGLSRRLHIYRTDQAERSV